MPNKRHLALVISSMRGGGAERVMSLLANAWAEHDDQATLSRVDGPHPDHSKCGRHRPDHDADAVCLKAEVLYSIDTSIHPIRNLDACQPADEVIHQASEAVWQRL